MKNETESASKNKLIAYAMDFASYFIENIDTSSVKNIILFGSASRGDADRKSDIDIFIEMNEKYEKRGKKILEDFYESQKFKGYWKLMGIENEIRPIFGHLDKWKQLHGSILSDGIVIYGKFFKKPESGSHQVIFAWENVKSPSGRVMVNKKIFGYSQGGKRYDGMLKKLDGTRLSKGCIMTSIENYSQFYDVFRKYKISVKIKKVVDYS